MLIFRLAKVPVDQHHPSFFPGFWIFLRHGPRNEIVSFLIIVIDPCQAKGGWRAMRTGILAIVS